MTEKHYPIDGTTESHVYLYPTGETAETTEKHDPTDEQQNRMLIFVRLVKQQNRLKNIIHIEGTAESHLYLYPTGKTAESIEKPHPIDGTTESRAYLCPMKQQNRLKT